MYAFALLVVLPALIAAAVPPPNLANDLFKVLDPNRDGKISKSEAETYFLGYDANKDGKITAAEFATNVDKVDSAFKGKVFGLGNKGRIARTVAAQCTGHEAALFTLLDNNADGSVTTSDLNAVFTVVDKNGDGNIDRPEFDTAFASVIATVG